LTRIVLIRHGETDWNIEGRYQGQADPPLNRRGLAQAHQLAIPLKEVGLDMLYSSPLLRALQTANVIAQELNLPLRTDSRLMEIHQGDWQERLRAEIEEMYPELFRRWQSHPWSVTPPGGESLKQVQNRIHSALDDILERHDCQCVGIVTHRIPIILTRLRYQSLDADTVRTLAMELPNTYWEEIS
jgi:probable phosphoglycerate mutase